ncbi:C2H2-type domain-containing protein [Trichostrongylus colubriformis]|uniref:C2H2-type domain-containing protein n=1 Tax=Trichostrongylus colubriformis TaxID=6319 RepID=A0AAN8FCE3_TRICO
MVWPKASDGFMCAMLFALDHFIHSSYVDHSHLILHSITKDNMKTYAKCIVCLNGPYLLSVYYHHLRAVHSWSEEDVEQEKIRIKQSRFPERDKIQCSFCSRVYFSLYSLRAHMEKSHAEQLIEHGEKGRFKVTCPGCHQVFRTGHELTQHCAETHNGENGQDFSIIEGNFANQKEFSEWLTSVECLTKVRFTRRFSRTSPTGRNHVFLCSHARGKGDVVDPKTMRQRFSISKRVHSHCPAFIKVVENLEGDSQGVQYVACLGHLGHKVGDALLKSGKYNHRIHYNHRKHKEALQYYEGHQDMIIEISNNTWAVVSEDGQEHNVVVGDPCHCEAETGSHCDRCGACAYQMKCDCVVTNYNGVPCVHCHAVATFSVKARELIPVVKHRFAASCSTTPQTSRNGQMSEESNATHFDPGISEEMNTSQELSSGLSSNECSNEPSQFSKTTVPPRDMTKIKKEAEMEYKQFQEVVQRLNHLSKACMQSNLPHVIREIRTTIESKLSKILSDKDMSALTSSKNRLRSVKPDLRELSHFRDLESSSSAVCASSVPSLQSSYKCEPVAEKNVTGTSKSPEEEHVLSRLAGFAAAVEASRRVRMVSPMRIVSPGTAPQVDEVGVAEHDYAGRTIKREHHDKGGRPCLSKFREEPSIPKRPIAKAKKPGQVLKRVFVKRGSEWVLKKVVVRSNTSNNSATAQLPLSSCQDHETRNDFEPDQSPPIKASKIVKSEVFHAGGVPSASTSSENQTLGTTSTDEEQSGSQSVSTKLQKIVERVVDSDNKPIYAEIKRKQLVQRMPPFKPLRPSSSKISQISEMIRKGIPSGAVPKLDGSRLRTEQLCLMCGKAKMSDSCEQRVTWLCCSNSSKCRARAHKQCLRGARLKCFVCHVGSWTHFNNSDEAAQTATQKQCDGRTPALTVVNS